MKIIVLLILLLILPFKPLYGISQRESEDMDEKISCALAGEPQGQLKEGESILCKRIETKTGKICFTNCHILGPGVCWLERDKDRVTRVYCNPERKKRGK